MASLEEFVSAVQSSIEALKQAQSGMDNPKQQAEELATQFQGLGAESMATGATGLKSGVEQTQGMIPPIITQLEQIITSAQGMKGLTTASPEARPPPTPLDAAPPALKEPVAQVGDPRTAPEAKPGAFQQELADNDDDDPERSRAARFGRAFSRRAEPLSNSFKEQSKAGSSMAKGYQPGPTGTVETVGTPEQPVVTSTMGDGPPVTDVVGTMVIGAAACVHAVTAFLGRRKRKGTT